MEITKNYIKVTKLDGTAVHADLFIQGENQGATLKFSPREDRTGLFASMPKLIIDRHLDKDGVSTIKGNLTVNFKSPIVGDTIEVDITAGARSASGSRRSSVHAYVEDGAVKVNGTAVSTIPADDLAAYERVMVLLKTASAKREAIIAHEAALAKIRDLEVMGVLDEATAKALTDKAAATHADALEAITPPAAPAKEPKAVPAATSRKK